MKTELTSLEVFHLVMKHCVECLESLLEPMILEGEIKDVKRSSSQMSQIFCFIYNIEAFRDRVFEMILMSKFDRLTRNITKSVHCRLKFST